MNVKLFLFLICYVYNVHGYALKSYIDTNFHIDEELFLDKPRHGQLGNTALIKTVTIFTCSTDIENEELLVYGNKAWRFPNQDTNLTLTYPPSHIPRLVNYDVYDEEYIITGFKVLLYVDTTDAKGFVNYGGVLQNYISLSFICPDINMLSYQFWLYGIPRSRPGFVAEHIQVNKMC